MSLLQARKQPTRTLNLCSTVHYHPAGESPAKRTKSTKYAKPGAAGYRPNNAGLPSHTKTSRKAAPGSDTNTPQQPAAGQQKTTCWPGRSCRHTGIKANPGQTTANSRPVYKAGGRVPPLGTTATAGHQAKPNHGNSRRKSTATTASGHTRIYASRYPIFVAQYTVLIPVYTV